jgi:hypothetical protein
MRGLGDREHEHQIERQFPIGDAAMLVGSSAQNSMPRRLSHAILRPRSAARNRLALRYSGLQSERVQHATHLATQRLVDDLVLLDA